MFRIASGVRDTGGHKVDAEAQPVQRVITTEGYANLNGQQAGKIPVKIISEMDAGHLASMAKKMCGGCRHFDNEEWLKRMHQIDRPDAPMEQRHASNEIRAALLLTENANLNDLHSGADGDMDPEHAMAALGLCRALTEHYNEEVIVHPISSCPVEVCSPTRQQGFYVARTKSEVRNGSAKYDAILRRAEGKIV